MKTKILTTFLFILISNIVTPLTVFAQVVTEEKVRLSIFGIIQSLIVFVIGLALLWFLYNVFVLAFAEKPDDRAKAKGYILWGIIGLTVMVFVWAGVRFISQTVFEGKTVGVSALKQETDSLQKLPTTNAPAPITSEKGTVQGVTNQAIQIIAMIIPLMVTLGVLIFIWGIFNYIREENVEKKAAASMFMLWGIVLLFIMSFMWVLVIMIGNSLNIDVKKEVKLKADKIQIDSLIKNKPTSP